MDELLNASANRRDEDIPDENQAHGTSVPSVDRLHRIGYGCGK